MLACKDLHDLPSSIAFRQVYEYGGGSWWRQPDGTVTQDTFCYYVSVACNHCGNPACVRVCPTGAMHKDERGLVSVDAARCIGCGYCALSCPYRAPKVDRDAGRSVEVRRLHPSGGRGRRAGVRGGLPLRALDFGPIDELREKYGAVADVPPLPDATATSPNLVLTPPAPAQADPDRVRAEGRVLNIREIV